MKKAVETAVSFVKDVRSELSRVAFPGKDETMGSTVVVVVFTVLFTVFLSIADYLLGQLLRLIV